MYWSKESYVERAGSLEFLKLQLYYVYLEMKDEHIREDRVIEFRGEGEGKREEVESESLNTGTTHSEDYESVDMSSTPLPIPTPTPIPRPILPQGYFSKIMKGSSMSAQGSICKPRISTIYTDDDDCPHNLSSLIDLSTFHDQERKIEEEEEEGLGNMGNMGENMEEDPDPAPTLTLDSGRLSRAHKFRDLRVTHPNDPNDPKDHSPLHTMHEDPPFPPDPKRERQLMFIEELRCKYIVYGI